MFVYCDPFVWRSKTDSLEAAISKTTCVLAQLNSILKLVGSKFWFYILRSCKVNYTLETSNQDPSKHESDTVGNFLLGIEFSVRIFGYESIENVSLHAHFFQRYEAS